VNQYLYAIVDRLPARWRPPTAGVGGASVVPRRVDDLVVLGSLVDVVPLANPRTLALHQDVVATVIDAPATLPFEYGTAVSALGLHDWLAANRALVATALASVRGCVEMTVKLLRLDGAITHRLGERERGRHPIGATERPGEPDLKALAEALAERATARQWRYRPPGSGGNVAAAVAFLVPRTDLAGFLARIAPVASHATGIAVVPTGPWAPSSFVPDFERGLLAYMATDPLSTARRRVG
jgi:Gas vesicle synthesis protein GvpL/GvpF